VKAESELSQRAAALVLAPEAEGLASARPWLAAGSRFEGWWNGPQISQMHTDFPGFAEWKFV